MLRDDERYKFFGLSCILLMIYTSVLGIVKNRYLIFFENRYCKVWAALDFLLLA